MTLTSELLSLRRDKSSSVETLLAAIEWERSAIFDEHRSTRHYAVLQAVDIVLLNVAAHASEQLVLFGESGFSVKPQPPKRSARRAARDRTPRRRVARWLRELTLQEA